MDGLDSAVAPLIAAGIVPVALISGGHHRLEGLPLLPPQGGGQQPQDQADTSQGEPDEGNHQAELPEHASEAQTKGQQQPLRPPG